MPRGLPTGRGGLWSWLRRGQMLNHNYIGTEHILPASSMREYVAAKALESFGISLKPCASR
jgi:hypothetical protein